MGDMVSINTIQSQQWGAMDRWSIKSHLAFSLDSRLGDNNCDPWIFQKSLEIEGAAFVSDSVGEKERNRVSYTISPGSAWQMSSFGQ